MLVQHRETYNFIQSDTSDFFSFKIALDEQLATLINNHLIIDVSKTPVTNAEINSLEKIAIDFRTNRKSFIIICNGIAIDNLIETIAVVPTETEAIDTFEMDEIERDLMGDDIETS